jgi:hypothetical protein
VRMDDKQCLLVIILDEYISSNHKGVSRDLIFVNLNQQALLLWKVSKKYRASHRSGFSSENKIPKKC